MSLKPVSNNTKKTTKIAVNLKQCLQNGKHASNGNTFEALFIHFYPDFESTVCLTQSISDFEILYFENHLL